MYTSSSTSVHKPKSPIKVTREPAGSPFCSESFEEAFRRQEKSVRCIGAAAIALSITGLVMGAGLVGFGIWVVVKLMSYYGVI
jgi:hypothetical protein